MPNRAVILDAERICVEDGRLGNEPSFLCCRSKTKTCWRMGALLRKRRNEASSNSGATEISKLLNGRFRRRYSKYGVPEQTFHSQSQFPRCSHALSCSTVRSVSNPRCSRPTFHETPAKEKVPVPGTSAIRIQTRQRASLIKRQCLLCRPLQICVPTTQSDLHCRNLFSQSVNARQDADSVGV